ncbi:hypothetical protein SCOCK_290051 [Actinacidiphila cocklensis]|uniref:Uncharacterized protein n=1 Tax=Actinacidiphila cocklensis TaxID=887465 RepID=A0A9W4GSG3_9ACTN|nr:hypothetical protein SCOCK_290051 [Actinacidiphila cocklensis]
MRSADCCGRGEGCDGMNIVDYIPIAQTFWLPFSTVVHDDAHVKSWLRARFVLPGGRLLPPGGPEPLGT